MFDTEEVVEILRDIRDFLQSIDEKFDDEEYNKALKNGVEAKVLPYNPNLSEDDELIMLLTCNVLVFSSFFSPFKVYRNKQKNIPSDSTDGI